MRNDVDTPSAFLCQQGFPESLRHAAAELYEIAFGAKLALALPNTDKRRAVLREALVPQYAFVVLAEGELVGLAGFKDRSGSLTGGIDFKLLVRLLGLVAAIRAALVLSLYERELAPGQLLMDGISVSPALRGKGIGSLLLRELQHYARQQGYQSLRLDVIDTNPDARRLYERSGFIATKTTYFSALRGVLGFGSATTMEYPVSKEKNP